MEGNLTKGPILKTLTKLAIPIMASSFLGTLYNITDMAWIGLLGSKAVAGIGVGGMFTWLSQGFASMARMGGQVQVLFASVPGMMSEKSDRIRPIAMAEMKRSWPATSETKRFWSRASSNVSNARSDRRPNATTSTRTGTPSVARILPRTPSLRSIGTSLIRPRPGFVIVTNPGICVCRHDRHSSSC